MTFANFNPHTNPTLNQLKLKFCDIIEFQQLKLVFEFHNNQLPSEIQSLFLLDSDTHHYQNISASYHFFAISADFYIKLW